MQLELYNSQNLYETLRWKNRNIEWEGEECTLEEMGRHLEWKETSSLKIKNLESKIVTLESRSQNIENQCTRQNEKKIEGITFTSSKLSIHTLEKNVKYVQNYQ